MDKCKIEKLVSFNLKKEIKDICVYYFSSNKLNKEHKEDHAFFEANHKHGLTYYFKALNYRDLNNKAKIINNLAQTNGLEFLIRAFKHPEEKQKYSCFVWFTDFENKEYNLSNFYKLVEY